MNLLRTMSSCALLAFALASFGQAAGEGARGSTAPGTSRDGAAPDEGAIKGGSLLPGEKGGLPSETTRPTTEGLKRCYELSGTLRDQCLLQEAGASTGGTGDIRPEPAAPATRPLSAPPPQNPR